MISEIERERESKSIALMRRGIRTDQAKRQLQFIGYLFYVPCSSSHNSEVLKVNAFANLIVEINILFSTGRIFVQKRCEIAVFTILHERRGSVYFKWACMPDGFIFNGFLGYS